MFVERQTTRTHARLGLDISLAAISAAKALDVFYLTDGRGQTLASGSLPRAEAALLPALTERGAATTAKEAR